ncbi:MAG: Fur family transcriptional regulator [Nitrospinota bacterium]
MDALGNIKEKFKKGGFRLTPQRLAVLKCLDGDTSHPGPNEIYVRLKNNFPSLSLTTVYNTLEMLKQIGEIIELTLDRERTRYDPDTSPHDHIICEMCKKIEDIPSENKKIPFVEVKGYKITAASTQFFGVCSKCQ